MTLLDVALIWMSFKYFFIEFSKFYLKRNVEWIFWGLFAWDESSWNKSFLYADEN